MTVPRGPLRSTSTVPRPGDDFTDQRQADSEAALAWCALRTVCPHEAVKDPGLVHAFDPSPGIRNRDHCAVAEHRRRDPHLAASWGVCQRVVGQREEGTSEAIAVNEREGAVLFRQGDADVLLSRELLQALDNGTRHLGEIARLCGCVRRRAGGCDKQFVDDAGEGSCVISDAGERFPVFESAAASRWASWTRASRMARGVRNSWLAS